MEGKIEKRGEGNSGTAPGQEKKKKKAMRGELGSYMAILIGTCVSMVLQRRTKVFLCTIFVYWLVGWLPG
jgi:hypothetical protein